MDSDILRPIQNSRTKNDKEKDTDRTIEGTQAQNNKKRSAEPSGKKDHWKRKVFC